MTAKYSPVAQAVAILKQGGLVAFPTETVYGLGADASNPEAVAKIFAAKGRPANHPLIVHIGHFDLLPKWALQIPKSAFLLAEQFWPGPLAMILHKQTEVSSVVTGGQNTIAIRIPNHPIALEVLRAFGGGVAAPSANRFQQISPTCATHVAEELGDKVDLILEGGDCEVGLESTIIDLSSEQLSILRPGHITKNQIEKVLESRVFSSQSSSIRAPGRMAVHYAPSTPAWLCSADIIVEQLQTRQSTQKIGVLAHSLSLSDRLNVSFRYLPLSASAYGHGLYAALRELDRLGLDKILVEQLPVAPEWEAVNDRLKKATIEVL